MKKIVTHISVDLDAVAAVWLVKRFIKGWSRAEVKFVPAGNTFNNQPPDKNDNIIHVDTGKGKFDHHQSNENTSATKKVYLYITKNEKISKLEKDALERLVKFVNDTDHFREVAFYQPTSDIYDLLPHQIIKGLKHVLNNDEKIVEYMSTYLDAARELFKLKIKAEKEIEKGLIFKTKFGKGIALITPNDETMKLAQKMGFVIAIRQDPYKKNIRIKANPFSKVDFTKSYEEILKRDKVGYWFLHSSKKMLLNNSTKHPGAKSTILPLPEVIKIVKKNI